MDITDNIPPSYIELPPPARLSTFVDIAKWRADRIADQVAFTFLTPAEGRSEVITYGELDLRIRSLAAVLADSGSPGQRVLIVQQPGIDYICSLFACLYAGMVAVPVYPLDVFRLRHTLPRLQAITRDADAPIMLTSGEALGGSADREPSASPLWDLCRQAVIRTDQVGTELADAFRSRRHRDADLAILQYTSGTTATPRGVALRHQHLVSNSRQIYSAYHGRGAVCVFWLPPYHDMGLVGGLLLPMYAGRPSVLMSPTSFVQQPLAWLEAITRYRGTTTASPNFGYELCLRKISDSALASLDLSSLRVAISGAEPIRASTMRRFSERFSPRGFCPSAFTPAYGMAEATLAITGKPLGELPVAVEFDADQLHNGTAAEYTATDHCDDRRRITVVGCGFPLDDTELRIVDPETRQRLDDNRVGEIWVRGPAVADQYWQQPELSAATFSASVATADSQTEPVETFLRTGDLGFMHGGQLFVSGRLKDLIIIAGQNYFAHELEAAVQATHDALKVDGGVAFSVSNEFTERADGPADSDSADAERLVMVQEVVRPKRYPLPTLVEHIRATLAERFGLAVDCVVLVAAGSLPKTSSGKLQRSECRQQFVAGELSVLHRWQLCDESAVDGRQQPESPAQGKVCGSVDVPATDLCPAVDEIAQQIKSIWCEVLAVGQVSADQHFLDHGGHSLAAIGMLSRIRERIGVTVDFETLYRAPRFGQLVAEVRRLAADQAAVEPAAGDQPDLVSAAATANGTIANGTATTFFAASGVIASPFSESLHGVPLTPAQRRFWVLDQLELRQAFLHVELTLRLAGALDLDQLARLITTLPERHAALRCRIWPDADGIPRQRFNDTSPIFVRRLDLRPENPTEIEGRLSDVRSAAVREPLNLQNGPVFHAVLIDLPGDASELILVAHHAICDAASLQLIVRDLANAYNGQLDSSATGEASSGGGLVGDAELLTPAGMIDWSQDQRLEYWRDRLHAVAADSPLAVASAHGPAAGEAVSCCGSDDDRPDSQLQTLLLPPAVGQSLWRRGRQWGVTPFEILLSAWTLVLRRYAESDDLVLGVPVAGRDQSRLETAIGCFINTLPYRHQESVDMSFVDYVRAVSRSWRRDLLHGEVPLDEIIDRLELPRSADRLPLIQHLVLHQPPVAGPVNFGQARCIDFSSAYSTLAAYDTALICQWRQLDLDGLGCEPRCDLGVAFNPQRINATTAANLLDGLVTLLDESLADPRVAAGDLRICGPTEARLRAVAQRARTFRRADTTVLDLFAQRVAITPDSVAVIDQQGAATFAQLDDQSNRLCQRLRRRGVVAGEIVALRLSRGRRLIIAALALWKAGAAYLPLDPDYPQQRLDEIVADAEPACLLTDVDFDELLNADESPAATGDDHRPAVSPTDLAYLIYTSGSTGKPKGVMIGHDNLANVLRSFAERPGLAAGQRILAATTMSFDISVLELFLPLVTGATGLITPRSLSEDPDVVSRWLATKDVDVVQATPSSLRVLLAGGWRPQSKQTIWCGGEPLDVDLAATLLDTGARLWNVYGPTETTVWSLAGEITDVDSGPILLGTPIDSTTLRIVDAAGRDVPADVAGELWIGGNGVGRGYWRSPALTAERFVATDAHGRMYRTGDIVRRRSDGGLEFLGRADRQVKLRGHRVELGEIEAEINRLDAVAAAAVTCVDLSSTDRRLVGFYQPLPDHVIVPAELRERLQSRLPGHMIPAALVPLTKIPTTPAGKIDYRRLPTDGCLAASALTHGDERSVAGSLREPATATERAIAEIWREVLRIDRIGSDDHFFHLGGHSLLAAQVFARIRDRLGADLRLRQIYSHPTVAELAGLVDQQSERDAATDSGLAAFVNRSAAPASIVGDPEENLTLSPAEGRLWFVDQLEPNHPFYNLPLAARIEGPLDLPRFWQSVDACVARHETLRSTYHIVDGTPVRRVSATMPIDRWSSDLSGHADAEAVLARELGEQSQVAFDLTTGPLLRVSHWRLGPDQHVILLVMHHIISDGWSMAVMLGELTRHYRAATTVDGESPRPLTATYRDYADWQAESLTPERIEPTIDYWRDALRDAPETIDLPTDHPRPVVQEFAGATLPVRLSGELTDRIKTLAESLAVTPYAVLMASYGLLLGRLSGQHDVCVGTAVANRNDPLVEELIGFFVNTVVVRQRQVGGESFAQYVRSVHQVATEAFEHQDVPFEQVVSRLAINRDRSHSPLFQAAMILQNTPDIPPPAEGLKLTPIEVDNGTAKYDLTLMLAERDGMLVGHFEFRTSLFRPQSIARFADAWQTLLTAALADIETPIDQLPVVSADAERAVLQRSITAPSPAAHPADATSGPPPQGTLHGWIAESIARHADLPAIRHGETTLTYAALDRRIAEIARGLQLNGVRRGDSVVVYSARSIDQVAAVIAVMRCGAAFVPIDTQFPLGRVVEIVTDLRPAMVVAVDESIADVRRAIGDRAPCHGLRQLMANEGRMVAVDTADDDLAYLIFTSGSTGKPKGVEIEHRSICNFVAGYCQRLRLTVGDRCGYQFSPSFDGAAGDIFPPLVCGGVLEVIDQDLMFDPPRLAEFLDRRGVDVIGVTPATLAVLSPQQLPQVSRVLSAGDALPAEVAARWLNSHQLFNGYGPTECTVGVAIHRMERADLVAPAVGRPLPGTAVYVLDDRRRLVPDGVIGEVYIGGANVGRGYFGRADLTAERFVPDPFLSPADRAGRGRRMYRTGDLGRWNHRGLLEIVGRCDDQVKLRGFRIEPGEIASVLDSLPDVARSAVVVAGDDTSGDGTGRRLVAYVVPEPAQLPTAVADGVIDAADGEDPVEAEHVENWRALFDQSQQGGVVFDPRDNFSGWSSVITGRPIPIDQMRAWADAAAGRIRDLQPRRLLEIGCGTGLMLLRIADSIEHYVGVDVLDSALAELRQTLSRMPDLERKVELLRRTADQLGELPESGFDTVVLNSVVQYFPSQRYLVRVLCEAERLLAPGGKIFLGDLRDLRLHRAFAIAAELPRCGDEPLTVGQFLGRVRTRVEHDEELLVAPDLFTHLKPHLPRLREVRVEVKTASGDSELNRFRYDAVLHFDRGPSDSHRRSRSPNVTVCNAHVHREVRLDRALRAAAAAMPLGDVIAAIDSALAPATTPAALAEIAENQGIRLVADWHPEAIDAVRLQATRDGRRLSPAALRRSLSIQEYQPAIVPQETDTTRFTSQPLVRRQSIQLTQRLRQQLQSRLPAYMVPSAFVVVDRLPMTVQGKLDRSALPPPPTQRLGGEGELRLPRNEIEACLVEVWEELLEISPVGIDDDFFELGGHSMLAVRMVSRVQQRTGLALPVAALFRQPTIAQLAELLRRGDSEASTVVSLSTGGESPPLFCIHPAGGTVFCYRELAAHFAGKRPVFGVQARGIDGLEPPHATLREMAADYATAILQAAPVGPLNLVGWSLGGNIAYEVAREVSARGRQIGLLALLDSGLVSADQDLSEADFLPLIAALFPDQGHDSLDTLRQKSPEEQLAYFIAQASQAGIVPENAAAVGPHILDVFQANIKAVHDHRTGPHDGPLVLIRPADQAKTADLFDDETLGWQTLVPRVEVASVPGDHAHMLTRPAVEQIARLLHRHLQTGIAPPVLPVATLQNNGDSVSC